MKNIYAKLLLIPLIFSLSTPAWGQNGLEETLLDMVEKNADGYLGPLATAFGTGLNSGVFHQAKPHKILGFDVTINASITTIPDTDLEYEFFLSDRLLPPLTVPNPLGGTLNIEMALSDIYQTGQNVPTFFGSKDPSQIDVDTEGAHTAIVDKVVLATGLTATDVESAVGSNITSLVNLLQPLPGPSGIGLAAWPTIMPQIAVGLPFNTEIMLRGFSVETPEGDPIKFGGFGGKISLSQFIPVPMFPIAISAGFYRTTVNLADIVEANNSIISLQASFSVPVITLYGGIGLESSDMSVLLEDESGNTLLDFSAEGKNKTRATIGVRLKLLLLSIHTDYNVGTYKSITAGIGLTLR